ncbi:MAG: JDVT-CTERM system CAAX-type protease [Gammaproteobacteria bacterium]|nr:JDVT-CTERM system CAAX-type protease [Gammaproteobacteria bacterium]
MRVSEYMVPPAQQLATELGLRRPRKGSLDGAFVTVLLLGAIVGWVLGSRSVQPDSATPMMLVSFLLWQPVVEELLFRGALQGALLRTITGTRMVAGLSVANIATSLAFVAIHFAQHPWLWAISVLVPSLLFGHYRERAGSVAPCILMHVLFNAAFFMWPLLLLL